MKLALVGVGSAGGRIVDRLVTLEESTGRNLSNGNVLVFDTAEDGFADLEFVPESRRAVFGDTHPEIGPDGTDGDPDLGVEVAREDIHELRRAFDDLEFTEVDGALLVAGLAGGTGGGAGAVLLEELQTVCDEPVYALGVLPAADEPDRSALNAARAFPSFVDIADNVVLFDNENWRSTLEYVEPSVAADVDAARTESETDTTVDENTADEDTDSEETSDAEDGEEAASVVNYVELNRAVATRILSLFGAGELESTSIAENRADASDLARTLETGGVSTIGRAELELDSPGTRVPWLPIPSWLPERLRSWLEGDAAEGGPTDAAKVKRLVRRAADGKLTLPCEIDSADRALVVLSGPPDAVSRKGFESARYWLERETDTVEVLAGDEPRPRASSLTATVLLSNVTAVPRIDALQQRAVVAQESLEDGDRETLEDGEFIW
ncbi:tubulin/FtsZ family protein [Natrarchaeobaculum sulfurireducens]|uniref:Tubulin-like protein CetZ n=1 Tax=Natrarchaeobaculum sulfurireducens TaxID=2044521 RepID=A0A346PAJ9_9EURY|nr:tubulin/FtsZ family protein [Natrarchaeobaculum sulfurireducens]AXR76544.1 Cell division GTPase [Natrarchaeobaculum sulfurireducens]AXR80221.1 GTPase domain, tubulin/FtsZ family protein [Natrarchaeobaculum sulfurireducens]